MGVKVMCVWCMYEVCDVRCVCLCVRCVCVCVRER